MTGNAHHSTEDMPVTTRALHGSAVILLLIALGQLVAKFSISLECLSHEGLASAVTTLAPARPIVAPIAGSYTSSFPAPSPRWATRCRPGSRP